MTDQLRSALEMAQKDRLRLVPFIGAGVSLSLGAPSWNDLVNRLLSLANMDEDPYKGWEPTDILQEIKTQIGERAFEAAIQHELSVSKNVTTRTLQSIVNSRANRIITTNLDYSIEAAFALAGSPLEPELIGRGDNDEELALFDQPQDCRVLQKIHGSLERPSSWVLTKSDYDKAYKSPGNLARFFREKNFIPLFIGFSFNDFDIKEALRFAALFPAHRSYAFIRKADVQRQKAEFRNRGVIPIPFHEFDQIPEAIDEIFECEHIRLEIIRTDDLLNRTKTHCMRVAAACVGVSREILSSANSISEIKSVLANALEFHPDQWYCDRRARRRTGQKKLYLQKLFKIVQRGDDRVLDTIISTLLHYPDVLFDEFLISALRHKEIEHFKLLQYLFARLKDYGVSRLEKTLISHIHEPNFPYSCRRDIAKVLSQHGLHPAMRIPPETIVCHKLVVCKYPLTRYQVGHLLGDVNLLDKNKSPVQPYTLRSINEVDKILQLLKEATNLPWRLPTPDEWTTFAIPDKSCDWPWGKELPDLHVHANLNFIEHPGSEKQVIEVGIFPRGQSTIRLFDLIGNVYELVRDLDNKVFLAGGAWSTAFKKSNPRFQMIKPFSSGTRNIGIRPVYER